MSNYFQLRDESYRKDEDGTYWKIIDRVNCEEADKVRERMLKFIKKEEARVKKNTPWYKRLGPYYSGSMEALFEHKLHYISNSHEKKYLKKIWVDVTSQFLTGEQS